MLVAVHHVLGKPIMALEEENALSLLLHLLLRKLLRAIRRESSSRKVYSWVVRLLLARLLLVRESLLRMPASESGGSLYHELLADVDTILLAIVDHLDLSSTISVDSLNVLCRETGIAASSQDSKSSALDFLRLIANFAVERTEKLAREEALAGGSSARKISQFSHSNEYLFPCLAQL